jgi:hypothetical protein
MLSVPSAALKEYTSKATTPELTIFFFFASMNEITIFHKVTIIYAIEFTMIYTVWQICQEVVLKPQRMTTYDDNIFTTFEYPFIECLKPFDSIKGTSFVAKVISTVKHFHREIVTMWSYSSER